MKAIAALPFLVFVACGAPPVTPPVDTPDACTPADCASLGFDCGEVPDGCGGTLACGVCADPETCGGGGDDNVCGCRPETDAAFCARNEAECGAVTRFDNCGASRAVDCGTCSGAATCGGTGSANVCGVNRCPARCDDPPANRCVETRHGNFAAVRYAATGSCIDPAFGLCDYPDSVDDCDEDCRDARCVQTPCTLGGFECTTPGTGCKLAAPNALRCMPIYGNPVGEGQGPCDTTIPEAPANLSCAPGLRCVKINPTTIPVCAYLCEDDTDCTNVGVYGRQECVITPESTYGYCE